MKRLIALAAAASLAGCSLVLVHPAAPDPDPPYWPRCTEHYFWSVADGATAALGVLGFILTSQSNNDLKAYGEIFEAGLAVGFGTSAVIGAGRTGRCRTVRAAYEKAALEGR